MPEEENMSSVTKNKEKKSESFADAYRRQREERQATKAQRKKS
jgi:hypothetical protein